MRTGISEDPKGDPTKITPHQPIPGRREAEGIEPLLPEPDPPRPGPGQTNKTPSDE